MKVKAYICTTDWNTELPMGNNDIKVFTTLNSLKANRTCWKECGIVEIEIIRKRTVLKGKGWESQIEQLKNRKKSKR